MPKRVVKKMFPGAVTSKGFFSYYNYIIEPNALHIFIIKGGPGVGKSTFMKKIADNISKLGYDIEYHCCSSDNNSIDGLVIPALGVALLDGTAPHIVDPKNPGAVDEIINLGDYWDENIIQKAKPEIMRCNYQVGRYFQASYYALMEAQLAMDEWEFYVKEHQNWHAINQMTLSVENDIFGSGNTGHGKERHLFAWAHTPQGKTQFIDTLLQDTSALYLLKGQPGTGKSTFLKRIAERAITYGLNVEYYHNTLDPAKLDLIIMPDLHKALCVVSEPYEYTPQLNCKQITLDFDQSVDMSGLNNFSSDIEDCRERVNKNIQRAIKNSSRAKATHDLMESYYIAAMDFSAIEGKRQEIEARIQNMLELGIAVSASRKVSQI
ncbi:ATP-dependent RecD-like DNA helicase [Desulfosporosinus acididurans]|uniref:ATP-dependent RecD-like DNA helicase n=1 Tax=Desulfosporosinus acididurans TaxID=476652 RepID=A0A0J1IJI5_9FIRM|nr:PRK06851 family protein [Desulfosporosinus acididurans]KLU64886.1 ATP-dependent RecD-like DNA helicase [Desulfosporosinus acididurans]